MQHAFGAKAEAVLPTVARPEKPPRKYFAVASSTRPLIRSCSASPTLMFFPET